MDIIIFNGNTVKTAGSIKVEDKVVITTTTSGEKVACPIEPITEGDEVTIVKLQNGDKLAVKSRSRNCVLISSGYHIITTNNNQIDNLGTFQFNWNGAGHVYIASSCSPNVATDTIMADDELSVSTSKGTVTHTYSSSQGSGVIPAPDLLINSILQVGINQVTVQIINIYPNGMGCGPLYITQVTD